MGVLYDRIGHGYADLRRPDPRIEARISEAIGDARWIVNVGAGTGSYEPRDRRVIAVEISTTMIAQRAADAAPVVQASACELPLRDREFDVALAVLTLHHWPDPLKGLRELRRVAKRVVLLTWDNSPRNFWLCDYFPEIPDLDEAVFPKMSIYAEELGPTTILPVSIPHDCSDGFLGAYWRRPEAYLDARVRSAISTFAKMSQVEVGLQRLRSHLEDGTWHERHADLLERDSLDLGYRLVIAE